MVQDRGSVYKTRHAGVAKLEHESPDRRAVDEIYGTKNVEKVRDGRRILVNYEI